MIVACSCRFNDKNQKPYIIAHKLQPYPSEPFVGRGISRPKLLGQVLYIAVGGRPLTQQGPYWFAAQLH